MSHCPNDAGRILDKIISLIDNADLNGHISDLGGKGTKRDNRRQHLFRPSGAASGLIEKFAGVRAENFS